jgi:hypothetical protein
VISFILSNNIINITYDNDVYFSCGYPRALPEQARTDTLSAPSHKEQAPPGHLRSIQSQSEQLSSLNACQRVPLVAVTIAMPRYYVPLDHPPAPAPPPCTSCAAFAARPLRARLSHPPALLLVTLLAPGSALAPGFPVANRHSGSSAGRHAVIRSATPQPDGRDTEDCNACSSAEPCTQRGASPFRRWPARSLAY